MNKTDSSLQHKWNGAEDTPFHKLLSQLSAEMAKTNSEQQQLMKKELENEKNELKKEWEMLKAKIKQEQDERKLFELVRSF